MTENPELPPTGTATFNQAQFQQMRLHEIMTRVNYCWMNILGTIENVPVYQILFDNLVSYFMEIQANISPDDADNINKKLSQVEMVVSKYTPWSYNTNQSLAGTSRKRMLNQGVYFLIRKELREFQSMILQSAQKFGLGNPTKKDPTKAAIN